MSDIRDIAERCPCCVSGWAPKPGHTTDEVRAAIRKAASTPRPEFAALIERKRAEQAREDGRP
jgi:hypothetical protein